MSREFFLSLAEEGHRVPLATDLVLHTHARPELIRTDGKLLGRVVEETARVFRSPLAFPLMDLRLEKAEIMRLLDVPVADIDRAHVVTLPSSAARHDFHHRLYTQPPGEAIRAHLQALQYVARETPLLPIGMVIGPFSLLTKLLADPIVPVYLSGIGLTAEDDPAVALLEACRELSTAMVERQVARQLAAGAKAIFVAEPAACQIFISPLQMEEGSDIFERMVMAPNRHLADMMRRAGADLIFHCCGEITTRMLEAFASLRPAMLSLGRSRILWEDARHLALDTVLYGNLPSKLFYSDALMSTLRVTGETAILVNQMKQCGHPFILGTECDTLYVESYAASIRAKIDSLMAA